MRVLLDECLPRRLAKELKGHEVSTVPECGWAGVRNGELLVRAAGKYDVFVTIDRLLAAQQAIPPMLAVITLRASSNRLAELVPLVPALRDAIETIKPGQVLRLGV